MQESESKLAVLMVIFKKTRQNKQVISAISIRELQGGLKKNYGKELSQRQILNIFRSLGKIIVKEKDPRDNRRTLYRINPYFIDEKIITLIKLDGESGTENNNVEGILTYPFSSTKKKKYLAVSHAY